MKLNWIILAFLLLSCNAPRLMRHKEAIVIYTFEKAKISKTEYYYFLKSNHLIINNNELDNENCISQPKQILEEAQNIIESKYGRNWEPKIQDIGSTPYFSKSNPKYFGDPMHYSDHIYEKEKEKNKLYIIYKANCDVIKFKRLSEGDSISCNHRYGCPIQEDLLNIPFYYVVNVDSFYPIDESFLKKKKFLKIPVDTFRVNHCD